MNKTRLVFICVVLLALTIVGSAWVYDLYTGYKTTQARLATAEANGTVEGPARSTATAEATAAGAAASARATAQSAQATATVAARVAEEAKLLSCEAPIDSQALPRRTWAAVTPPPLFVYATPFDANGTGPFSVQDGEQKLFHYRPLVNHEPFVLVKCLFLHVSVPSSPDSAPATLNFSIWSPTSGGWSINGGKNKLAWGENLVEIQNPDSLVSRQSDLYFAIRNYGAQSITIQRLNLTLWLINSDSTYTIIRPTSK